jgi:xylose isomerase
LTTLKFFGIILKHTNGGETMKKYSVILGNLGNTCDRFLSTGYKDQPPKAEMIRQAAAIPGVTGVELVGNWDVTRDNCDEVGEQLAKSGLRCVSIIPDHFSQKRWGKGAFTSKDPVIRAQALDETMTVAEIARKLQCPLINLWPGQDGYD